MMKLRRKLSGVLASKKPNPDITNTAIVPMFTIPEVNIERSDADSQDWHETQFQNALMDSLHEQQHVMEQDITRKDDEISRLRQQLRRVEDEKRHQDALLSINAQQQSELQETIMHMRLEHEALERKYERDVTAYQRQVAEQLASINEYQALCIHRTGERDRSQMRANVLGVERTILMQSMNRQPAQTVQAEEAGHLMQDLQTTLAQAQAETQQLRAVDAMNRQLTDRITALETEILVARAEAEARTAQDELALILQRDQAHTAVTAAATSSLPFEPTPRMILITKILGQVFDSMPTNSRPEVTLFMRSCTFETLTRQSLDIRLSQEQAECFAGSINSDDLTILACDLCRLPKFVQKDGAQHSQRIDEFASMARATSCCSKNICNECYLSGIKRSLYTDWWVGLNQRNWIVCPAPSCGTLVLDRSTPKNLLRQLGDGQIGESMKLYNRIKTLRTALRDLSVNEEAAHVACMLHMHLIRARKMNSMLDPASHNAVPNEAGLTPPFDLGNIQMVRVEYDGRSIDVPLFVSFLRRDPNCARECAFCAEEILDVDIGSPDDWLEFCSGFPGDWMWNVLQFPMKLRMECRHDIGFCQHGDPEGCWGDVDVCRHDIDFCTECLQRHLDAQLEQHGRQGCDRLSCPGPGCGRLLDHREIKLYAKGETFEKYDNYLSLKHLSEDPMFKWCLRPGCGNGDLHDDSGGPRIQCSECAFEMCHKHGVPWHQGQTCEQYDNAKEHGDPDFQRTVQWIERNTKPCPNCSQNIQKGDMCFHMTCSQCQAEFCWECLADWRQIYLGLGEHNVNAHKEGCPFRTNGILPTHITGETLTAAIERRGQ